MVQILLSCGKYRDLILPMVQFCWRPYKSVVLSQTPALSLFHQRGFIPPSLPLRLIQLVLPPESAEGKPFGCGWSVLQLSLSASLVSIWRWLQFTNSREPWRGGVGRTFFTDHQGCQGLMSTNSSHVEYLSWGAPFLLLHFSFLPASALTVVVCVS